jgi:peptidoglycan/xylan/chitin deacetylase (PgdA/CDA1 family)
VLTALYYAGLESLGLATLSRMFRNAGVVLCYHNVVPQDSDVGGPGLHMPVERFRRQMGWLAAHYQVVPLRELVARVRSGKSARDIAAITFDDAYAGVFDTALPVLRDLGITSTVFVVTDAATTGQPYWWDHPAAQGAMTAALRRQWLDVLRGSRQSILAELPSRTPWNLPPSHRPAEWSAITAAARSGIDLGVHSVTHRVLPRLTDAELANELTASRDVVAGKTGQLPEFFAYPYGLWDERVQRAVKAAGYGAALALDNALVRVGADVWALPRINVPAAIGMSAFRAWTAGLRPSHRLRP